MNSDKLMIIMFQNNKYDYKRFTTYQFSITSRRGSTERRSRRRRCGCRLGVSGLVPGHRTRRPRVRGPCSPRHGGTGSHGSKRRQDHGSPQAGDRLGTKRTTDSHGDPSVDGRHLGCSGSRSSSRGNGGGGPRGEAPRLRGASPGVLVVGLSNRLPNKGISGSSRGRQRATRQEVSEPIGLGQSSPGERSPREEPESKSVRAPRSAPGP
jgi:hypothetical protein